MMRLAVLAALLFLASCDEAPTQAARRQQCPAPKPCPTCPAPVVCPVLPAGIGPEKTVEEVVPLAKYAVSGRYSIVGFAGTITDLGVVGFTRVTTTPLAGQYRYDGKGIYQFHAADLTKTVTINYRLR